MRSAAGRWLMPECVPLSLLGATFVSGGSGVGSWLNTLMPFAIGVGLDVRPPGCLTAGAITSMPISRATISVVMFDTRQSPTEYHIKMFFAGLPNRGSLITCDAVVIGS